VFFGCPKLQFPIFQDFRDLEFRYPRLRVFGASLFSAFRDFKFRGFGPRRFQTHFVLQAPPSEILTHSTLRVHSTVVAHYHGGMWQVHEDPRRFQRRHRVPPLSLLFSSCIPTRWHNSSCVHLEHLPIEASGVGVL
jgi:hypothetical protein